MGKKTTNFSYTELKINQVALDLKKQEKRFKQGSLTLVLLEEELNLVFLNLLSFSTIQLSTKKYFSNCTRTRVKRRRNFPK